MIEKEHKQKNVKRPSFHFIGIRFQSLKQRSINNWQYRYSTDTSAVLLVQIYEPHLRHRELRILLICQIDKTSQLTTNYASSFRVKREIFFLAEEIISISFLIQNAFCLFALLVFRWNSWYHVEIPKACTRRYSIDHRYSSIYNWLRKIPTCSCVVILFQFESTALQIT